MKYQFNKNHEPVVEICKNLASLFRSSWVLLTEFNKLDEVGGVNPDDCLKEQERNNLT